MLGNPQVISVHFLKFKVVSMYYRPNNSREKVELNRLIVADCIFQNSKRSCRKKISKIVICCVSSYLVWEMICYAEVDNWNTR